MKTVQRARRWSPAETWLLRMAWEDENGVPHWTCGTCVDVSDRGVKVLTSDAVPSGITLEVTLARLPLAGRARVRHCTPKRMGRFMIGLEFADLESAPDTKKLHAHIYR